MSKTVKYTEAPRKVRESLDRAVVIEDPLPSPEQLVRKVKKERITILVPKRNLDFFRGVAKEHGVGYQTLINRLLDDYVDAQEKRMPAGR